MVLINFASVEDKAHRNRSPESPTQLFINSFLFYEIPLNKDRRTITHTKKKMKGQYVPVCSADISFECFNQRNFIIKLK